MRLKKLVLKNYCQYDDYSVDFEEGVTILKGKNGRGKSNLMNSVFFALTGDSCIKSKTRSNMLKWGCDKGSVRLDFEIHGGAYSVVRQLHSSSVSLEGGDLVSPITKSREATEYVARLIKADADILKISSFMPQSGANELVFGTKTERQKAFSRLFRLLHLEQVRTDLQKEYNKIPAYPDQKDLIGRLTGEIAVLGQSLSSLSTDADIEFIKKHNDKYNRLVGARGKKLSEAEYNKELSSIKTLLADKEGAVISLKEELASLPEPVVISYDESEKYRQYKEFESICSSFLELREKLEKPAEPVKKVTDIDVAVLDDRINKLSVEMSFLGNRLSTLEKGFCSECGRPFEMSEEELRKLRGDFAEKTVRNRILRTERAEAYQAAQDYRKYIDELERDRKQFEELALSVNDKGAYFEGYDPSAYLKKQEEAEKSADNVQKRRILNESINKLVSEASDIKQSIVVLEAEGCRPSDYSEDFILDYEKRAARVHENEIKKAAIEAELKVKKEQLAARSREQMLREAAERHRRFISDIRNVLHVDNYPRLAIAIRKENMSSILNKYLAIFLQPFTVSISDSLEFVCAFPDNPSLSADELSMGQKAMLLVSVRLAIAEMLARDVELLTFDEPGAALDKDAKQGLVEAFDAVRKYLSGQRIQMLVASHDDNIEGIADSVIQL